jgi:sulfonate transport system permease protein
MSTTNVRSTEKLKKIKYAFPFSYKKGSYSNLMIKFGTPLILLLLWEFLSVRGLISTTVLPAPSVIGTTFLDLLLTGEIFVHVGTSFLRIIQGFVIGGSLGVIVGILTGLNKKFEQAISLITGLLRPIPMMAWVPVLILWMGIDEASKITLIIIASFWPTLINVVDGIKNTDQKYLEVAQILEKKKTTLILRVILPSAFPSIFTGLRLGMDMAWRSVVGAELIAASSGIGYMISYARELSQTDVMLAGVLCIGIIGLLLDVVLKKIQAHVIKWNVNYFK